MNAACAVDPMLQWLDGWSPVFDQLLLWCMVSIIAAILPLGMIALMHDATKVTAPERARVWRRIGLVCALALIGPFFATMIALLTWAVVKEIISWVAILQCDGPRSLPQYEGHVRGVDRDVSITATLVVAVVFWLGARGIAWIRRRLQRPKP